MDELRAGSESPWMDYAQRIAAGKLPAAPALIWLQAIEEEIERRGLRMEYVAALEHIVVRECSDPDLLDTPDRTGVAWLLLRATPEQRAQAFLKAVSE